MGWFSHSFHHADVSSTSLCNHWQWKYFWLCRIHCKKNYYFFVCVCVIGVWLHRTSLSYRRWWRRGREIKCLRLRWQSKKPIRSTQTWRSSSWRDSRNLNRYTKDVTNNANITQICMNEHKHRCKSEVPYSFFFVDWFHPIWLNRKISTIGSFYFHAVRVTRIKGIIRKLTGQNNDDVH